MNELQRRVLAELDEGELQRMMEQLIELPSPTGEEGRVGERSETP